MTVTLLKTGDKRLVADKQTETIADVSGNFRGTVTIENPTFTLQLTSGQDISEANYCSITFGSFTRYYYIVSRRCVTSSLYEITCELDYRKTFLSHILGQKAIVDRAQSNYNMYIPDGVIRTSAREANTIVNFSYTPFDENAHCITMIVSGGK